jgi:hypothetical protein
MGSLRLVVVLLCLLVTPLAASSAHAAEPKSASAFRESVGVSTHIVYYSTAYGNWPLLVDRLQELGIRHLRDGTYANPGPQWAKWNERYYQAVEYAADRGLRFNFGLGSPGYQAGTLDQLIAVVAGRLRRAAEAVENPNEFDKFFAGPRWAPTLASYSRELYRKVKANPSLRSLPVVGPSLVEREAPLKLGDQSAWLDRGNIHPYAGGASPNPLWIAAERERISHLSGNKPIWATEAGYHNAVHAKTGMPPTSEAAGAVYTLRTVLEHFKAGIARTYLYELVDLYPDPGAKNANWNFGLLRNDYSRKPAFRALKNLLTLVGDDKGRPRLEPLRLELSARDRAVRQLVLQRADGTYVVALWRLSSVWDRDRRHPVHVPGRRVKLTLPDAARVAVADPMSADEFHAVRLRRGQVSVPLAGRPVLLHVTPKR